MWRIALLLIILLGVKGRVAPVHLERSIEAGERHGVRIQLGFLPSLYVWADWRER